MVTGMSLSLVDGSAARGALSRPAVLAAAGRLADRDGVDALTMTRLADSLGVTLPALYNHVRNGQDCLYGVALQARVDLLRRLSAAARGRQGDQAVTAVAHAWRAFVRRHPGRYAATDRHPVAGHPELEGAVERIVDLLEAVVAGYGVPAELARPRAWSLRAALHGFVALEAEQGHPRSLLVDQSFQALLQLLCIGLRASSRGPHPVALTPSPVPAARPRPS